MVSFADGPQVSAINARNRVQATHIWDISLQLSPRICSHVLCICRVVSRYSRYLNMEDHLGGAAPAHALQLGVTGASYDNAVLVLASHSLLLLLRLWLPLLMCMLLMRSMLLLLGLCMLLGRSSLLRLMLGRCALQRCALPRWRPRDAGQRLPALHRKDSGISHLLFDMHGESDVCCIQCACLFDQVPTCNLRVRSNNLRSRPLVTWKAS